MKTQEYYLTETADLRTLAERLGGRMEPLTATEITSWQQSLPRLKGKILSRLKLLSTRIRDGYRYHQQLKATLCECVELMDLLFGNGSGTAGAFPLKDQLEECLRTVYGECVGLADTFGITGDNLPLKELACAKKHAGDRLNGLKIALSVPDIDPELKRAILQVLLDFLATDVCSRERVSYLMHFIRKIEEACSTSATDGKNMQLMETLYEVNYNTEFFVGYYQRMLGSELEALDKVEDQLDLLYQYKLKFAKKPSRVARAGYDPGKPCIREVMNAFRKLQSAQIKNRHKFQTETQPISQPWPLRMGTGIGFQIDTSMSVGCLAYLVRLLADTALVSVTTKAQLLSFVAGAVRTPGTAVRPISVESLTTKYKQVTQHTATTVRAALKKMLRRIDDDFSF